MWAKGILALITAGGFTTHVVTNKIIQTEYKDSMRQVNEKKMMYEQALLKAKEESLIKEEQIKELKTAIKDDLEALNEASEELKKPKQPCKDIVYMSDCPDYRKAKVKIVSNGNIVLDKLKNQYKLPIRSLNDSIKLLTDTVYNDLPHVEHSKIIAE